MKNVFLINETILFEPEHRRLGPRKEYPQRALTLHGPVNECLLQLLEHNEQVLTQRYLFSAVWEKQGAVVTTNALYQTIASIRKALKTAGLEEDIIKTLPKEGFKCIAQIQRGELADFSEPQKIAEEPLPDATSSKIAETAPVARKMPLRPLFYSLAGLLFIISCGVFYWTWKSEPPALAKYHPVGQLNGCEVFSSWYDRDKSQRAFQTLSRRYPLQCQPGERAYITLSHAQRGVTVIICDNDPQDSQARCHSIYYRQIYHEDE